MSITNFFFIFAVYGIRAFQVSDTANEFSDDVYVNARIMTCITSILLCAIFLIISGYTAYQYAVVIIYMVFRGFEAFADVFHGIQQKHWRMDYVGISLGIRGLLSLGVFIVLGWLYGLLAAVIGMAVTAALVVLLFDLYNARKLSVFSLALSFSKFNRSLALLKICFPMLISGGILVIVPSFVRLQVEIVYGTDELGIFSTVTTPTLIVQILASFLILPAVGIFSSAFEAGNYRKFIKIFIMIAVLITGVALVAYIGSLFLGEWGLVFLFGGGVKAYSYLLPQAIIVSGFTGLIWYVNMVFTVIRDFKGLLTGLGISAAISLISANWFLTEYGLSGANYVMIATQGAAMTCLLPRLFWFILAKRKESRHY